MLNLGQKTLVWDNEVSSCFNINQCIFNPLTDGVGEMTGNEQAGMMNDVHLR